MFVPGAVVRLSSCPSHCLWLSTFLPFSQVGLPGESRWQVGPAVEDNLALGAPQVGGLPDLVPEGTLLNMVLKRMHRPRSCSYQLLLEHRRPSRIQGLRWVSVLPFQASRAPGLEGAWTIMLGAAGGPAGSGGAVWCSWGGWRMGERGCSVRG